MKQLESILYISILAIIGLIGIYLQESLLADTVIERDFNRHDPDYYVENFTATGLDKTGERRFVINAGRMAHFPDDDTALFDYPHVIEYQKDASPKHTYADSGWMNSTGSEIILTGNVKIVIEAYGDEPGGTINTKKMRILLDRTQDVLNLSQ